VRSKVLLLSTVFPNSAQPVHGVFVRERMRGLPADLEVRVVAPAPWFPLVSGLRAGLRPRVPAREVQDGVEVLHPRFLSVPGIGKCLDGVFLFLSLLPVLMRLRWRFQFEVIDAHFTYPEGLAAVLLGKVFKVPVVITERGTLPLLARFRLRRPQLRFALRHADRVVAVSESLRRDAIGLGREGVRVIENGIDGEVFRAIDREAARCVLSLLEGCPSPAPGRTTREPLLVSVGTLAPRKGFHLVIEAMFHLVERFPGIRFAMVGGAGPEGAMEKELRGLAEKLGVADRVIFTGPRSREELYLWYSAADVFVLASAHEGCPNVVLEALACGTPVVATPVGNIPQILTPKVGILADRDIPALTMALAEALDRTWDREAIQSRIRSRTWQAVGLEAAEEIRAALSLAYTEEPSRDRRRPQAPLAGKSAKAGVAQ
jgi:glycosyltransferase involved in cell wall biosynthesis